LALTILALLLVVCAASIGYSLFLRHGGGGEEVGFRVEVLNGTGRPGLAAETARALRSRGIDVLRVGNADRFDYTRSVLVVRRRGPDIDTFARLIGCREVVEQLRPDDLVDATLVLGADYRDLKLGLERE